MNKLFYNPHELPAEVKLESKCLGVSKHYQAHTGEGPVWLEELFKLAATESFEKVEVLFTAHNEAYYRDKKNPLEKVAVEGWVDLKTYKNGGGYHKDRTITITLKK